MSADKITGDMLAAAWIAMDQEGDFQSLKYALAAVYPLIAAQVRAEFAPTHADLMVAPDTLDAFMAANPPPPDRVGDLADAARAVIAIVLEEAAASIKPCQYDGGFDRDIGPIGCRLETDDGCVCLATWYAIRALNLDATDQPATWIDDVAGWTVKGDGPR